MATAQNLLDALHALSLFTLVEDTLSKKERLARISLAKKKLRAIKRDLRQEQQTIKRRWDGRNRYEAIQEEIGLLPFGLIDTLVSELEIVVAEIEVSVKHDRPLPEVPLLPDVVIEDTEDGTKVARLFTFDAALSHYQTLAQKRHKEFQSVNHEIKATPSPPGIVIWGLFLLALGFMIVTLFVSVGTAVPLLLGAGVCFLILFGLFGRVNNVSQLKKRAEILKIEGESAVVKYREVNRHKKARNFITGINRFMDAANEGLDGYRKLVDAYSHLGDNIPESVSTVSEIQETLKIIEKKDRELKKLTLTCSTIEEMVLNETKSAMLLLKQEHIPEEQRIVLEKLLRTAGSGLAEQHKEITGLLQDFDEQLARNRLVLAGLLESSQGSETDT